MRSAPTQASAPFTDTQRAMLDVMMDLLIPASPDGRMLAARTLGLYDDPSTLRAVDRSLFDAGLAVLAALALERHGLAFERLDMAKANALVEHMRTEHAAFVQSFVAQTVGRYLANPAVMPLIGLEPRPLWPKGQVVEEGEWSLLDVVKQREKIYRKV